MAADDRGFRIASAYVEVSLDEDQLDAEIAGLNSKLAGIRDKAISVGIPQAQVDAAIADIQAKLDSIRDQNAGVGLNQGDLDAAISAIQAKLAALGAEHVQIRVGLAGGPETTAELGGLAAVMKTLEATSARLADAVLGLSPPERDADEAAKTLGDSLSGLAGVAGSAVDRLMALAGSADNAADAAKYAYAAVSLAGIGVKKAGDQARSTGGWMGMLTKEVTLFGGALGNVHMVGAIPLWHILMDGILETAIALTEATVALTAFGLAAARPAEDIYTHLKAVHDVVQTLGIDIPPVTGHMQELSQALAPQMVELYGAALNVVSGNGTALAGVIKQITTGFDDWMAKLDLFEGKQAHNAGLVKSGADVLQQMGVILGNLGAAFTNLMKSDPGTVHFLGDLLELGSKVVEVFTEIPTPILYTALAIHSFMLWGGLLTTGITKVLGPLGSLVGVFGKLPGVSDEAASAIAKVADGVKTMGGVFPAAAKGAADLGKETEKTAQSGHSMLPVLQALSSAGVWGWAGVGAVALGGLVFWMMQADSATKGFISNLQSGLSQLDPGQAILQIGADIQKLDGQVKLVAPHIQDLNEQTSHLETVAGKQLEDALDVGPTAAGWAHLTASVAAGAKAVVSWLGLAHASMDKASDVNAYKAAIVQLTQQQDNLFHQTSNLMKEGYTYSQSLALMGLAGVQASDSFQRMQQKVENLIKGYQDMSVQGGLLANSVNAVTFASEEQDSKVQQLAQGWQAFIGMVTGGQSAFDTFETQMQGVAQAATTAVSKMTLGGGKTSMSTQLQTTGAAASGAKFAIDGLSASSLQLNQAFGQGITDADSMMNALLMQASAAGLGAKGTAMLTQAGKDMVAQLLPMAQGSSEATAQLYALAQQAGYQGPDSFSKLVTWVGKTKDAEQNLQQITSRLTVASANLSGDVENLAQALNQDLNQAMSAAIFQASGGQKAFDAFATAAIHSHGNLDKMQSSATQLAAELLNTIGSTTQAHNEFDAFAIQMGLTKTQADKLWASVVRLAKAESDIPAHVSSIITITEQIEQSGGTKSGITGINNSALPRAAHGMLVQGGIKGQDSVLILAKPGEAVVPEELVPPIAPYLAAHKVPGFAQGGIVPDWYATSMPAGQSTAAVTSARPVHIEMNYYGPQHPTPEMNQATIMALTRAVGVAG